MANGAFMGGLAQGLMGGYQFADEAMARRQGLERQQRFDELALDQKAQENELRRQHIGNETARLKAQQSIWDAQIAGQNLENDKEREALARQKRLDNVPLVEQLVRRMKTEPDFTPSPEQFKLFQETLGWDPQHLVNPQHMEKLKNTFMAVRDGKLDMNSPQAIEAANSLYGTYVQRGMGAVHTTPEGVPIKLSKPKEIAGFMPYQDSGKFAVRLKVTGTDKNGKEHIYYPPMTEYGSSDQNDQVVLLDQNTLETPLAQSLLFHNELISDPNLMGAFERGLAQLKGVKDMSAKDQAEIDYKRAATLERMTKAGQNAGLYGEGKGKAAEFNFDPGRFEKAYELSNEPPEKPPEEPAFTGDKKTDEAIFKQHQKALQDYPKRVEAWKKERAKASEETQNLMRLNRLTMDEAISLRKPQNFFHGVDDEGKTRFPGQYVEGFLAQDENGQTRLYYSSVLDPKTGREMTPKEAKAAPKTGLVGGALEKDTPKTASKPAPKKTGRAAAASPSQVSPAPQGQGISANNPPAKRDPETITAQAFLQNWDKVSPKWSADQKLAILDRMEKLIPGDKLKIRELRRRVNNEEYKQEGLVSKSISDVRRGLAGAGKTLRNVDYDTLNTLSAPR
jgi:hypothetical protein